MHRLFYLNFQDGVTSHMEQMWDFHNLINNILLSILFIVLATLVMTWYFNGFNSRLVDKAELEFFWTIIPACILFCMAIPSLILLYQEFPDYQTSFIFSIMAHQWYWSLKMSHCPEEVDSMFIPDDGDEVAAAFRSLEVDNSLLFPLNQGIHLYVTSADVIHSFALPSMGVKVDAVPGRLNEFFLFPLNIGKYYGQCSEICGANHAYMPISVEVVPFDSSFFSNS